jgi:hypothetical protein
MSFSADVDTSAFMIVLRRLGEDVLPDTIAETLNETADAVTRRSLRYMNARLTVRTRYTTNSVTRAGARPYQALNKARGRNIQRMFSRAGTISPYLSAQDRGGVNRAKNRGPIPIPHKNVRQGKSAMRAIARRYRLTGSEKLRPGHVGAMTGDRYFIGRPRGGKYDTYGLYERGYNNKRLRLLRNLEHTRTIVKPTKWHSDAANELGKQGFIRARFARAARRRLERMRRNGR